MPLKTITPSERLQLIGLLTLAAKHNNALKDIASAAREITGEHDDMGHTADAVYGEGADQDVDELLKRVEASEKRRAGHPGNL